MSKNVQIPLSLFHQTIDLLECINLGESDPFLSCYLYSVLSALLKKKQSLDLRNSYAKIIFSQNDDERFDARMSYLFQKRKLSDE